MMTCNDTISAIVELWKKQNAIGKGTPFAKFLLDAFHGEGLFALYSLTDAQVLKQLKAFYKQHNRSNPLKGGK